MWTIATGDQLSGDDDPTPTTTATQDQPVSTEEAEGTVRGFYSALQDDGLEAARRFTVEGVPVDEAIAEGLDSVEVSVDSSRELGQGVVETVATATYTYGPCVIVQEETMQVARRGTEALIVQRVTRTTSTSGCSTENVETGAGGDADDGDEGGGNGTRNENSGPGNNSGNNGNNGNGSSDGDAGTDG